MSTGVMTCLNKVTFEGSLPVLDDTFEIGFTTIE